MNIKERKLVYKRRILCSINNKLLTLENNKRIKYRFFCRDSLNNSYKIFIVRDFLLSINTCFFWIDKHTLSTIKACNVAFFIHISEILRENFILLLKFLKTE